MLTIQFLPYDIVIRQLARLAGGWDVSGHSTANDKASTPTGEITKEDYILRHVINMLQS